MRTYRTRPGLGVQDCLLGDLRAGNTKQGENDKISTAVRLVFSFTR